MGDRKHPISPDTLYARLGFESAPVIVAVRRDATIKLLAMTLLALTGISAVNDPALAQQPGCKVCADQQRACMKNYAGPTCKSEYRMCMKSCGKKS